MTLQHVVAASWRLIMGTRANSAHNAQRSAAIQVQNRTNDGNAPCISTFANHDAQAIANLYETNDAQPGAAMTDLLLSRTARRSSRVGPKRS